MVWLSLTPVFQCEVALSITLLRPFSIRIGISCLSLERINVPWRRKADELALGVFPSYCTPANDWKLFEYNFATHVSSYPIYLLHSNRIAVPTTADSSYARDPNMNRWLAGVKRKRKASAKQFRGHLRVNDKTSMNSKENSKHSDFGIFFLEWEPLTWVPSTNHLTIYIIFTNRTNSEEWTHDLLPTITLTKQEI